VTHLIIQLPANSSKRQNRFHRGFQAHRGFILALPIPGVASTITSRQTTKSESPVPALLQFNEMGAPSSSSMSEDSGAATSASPVQQPRQFQSPIPPPRMSRPETLEEKVYRKVRVLFLFVARVRAPFPGICHRKIRSISIFT
jgi:hypothetical protein